MLHGVQLISKPNISQNGLIYLARLQLYQEKGIPILVYGLRQQPRDLLLRTRWLPRLGGQHVFGDMESLRRYLEKLDKRGIEKNAGAG